MSSPDPLSAMDRAALLGIAGAALRHHLGLGPAPQVPETGTLAVARGAFVTHKVNGELRGCIGSFEPTGTLARTVAAMSVSAACEDPRFEPIRSGELEGLSTRVSALTPRSVLHDPTKIVIGRDGLLVRAGWHRGALLPCVAVEHEWDVPTFLKHVCLKAGLPADAWRDSKTVLEVFGAEEFGDPEE
jgi:AmmeMemoRadiSam system protein A